MKNYDKIGNRNGKPAYRTPATFRTRKAINLSKHQVRRGRRPD